MDLESCSRWHAWAVDTLIEGTLGAVDKLIEGTLGAVDKSVEGTLGPVADVSKRS